VKTTLYIIEFSREFTRQVPSGLSSHGHATHLMPSALPPAYPVTLLSPLTALKKGADALYIGVLSPCHPFPQISNDQFGINNIN